MLYVVLGILGVVAYEVLKRGPSGAAPSLAQGTPTPASVTPAQAAAFEDPPRFLASPMRMARGQRYRMRYDSQLFDPTVLFSEVTLYQGASALPGDWPAITTDTSDPATLFAAGYWTGPSTSIDTPRGLWQVWPTLSQA